VNNAKSEIRHYALRRGLGTWEVTFEGRRDSFADQQGAEYVVWLLTHPPLEPIHAVNLALEVNQAPGDTPWGTGGFQQRSLGLDDAETVRRLRRQARAFGAVLENEMESEAAKAEARRQREEILEFLRTNPWRSRDCAQKCVRAISMAIRRLYDHLAEGVDAEGKSHPVLQDFAWHLFQYLLVPSGRGGEHGGARRGLVMSKGCFTYEPPDGVVWVSRA
jgi:hypothetical protein